jgi:hypothetical protein
MDLKQYFSDLRAKEAELQAKHSDGVVHVTSLFYRERNSTPGAIASATCRNAARVITDGTHRESSEEEIERFYSWQEEQLKTHIRAEQQKKQQYVIVTGGAESNQALNATVMPAQKGRGPKSQVPTE